MNTVQHELDPEVIAAGRLIGLLKPDVVWPDDDFFVHPLAKLEGVPQRLDQLVALLDAALTPDASILEGTTWHRLGDTVGHIVSAPGQLGAGVHVASDSGAVDALAYLPLIAFDASGSHFIAGPLHVRVTETAVGKVDVTVPFDGSLPSGTLTLSNGTTFAHLSDVLDARKDVDAVLALKPPFLDETPPGSGQTVGQILVAADVLAGASSPYTLSPTLSGPPLTVALNVLLATLRAVAGKTPIVKLEGDGGGIFVDATNGYGLRVAGEHTIEGSSGPSVVLSFGSPLTGGTADDAGIHVGVLDDQGHFAPSLALTSCGVNLVGAGGKPLVDARGWTLAGVELRGSHDFASESKGTWAVAGQVDAIGTPLAGGIDQAAGNNPVASSLVASGPDQPAGDPAAPVNPPFSVRAGYATSGGFSFQALDDKYKPTDIVWVTIQRRFGPISISKIGVEATSGTDADVGVVVDGGVKLGGLDVELDELSLTAPLHELSHFNKYTLDLKGLTVAYTSDAFALSGGLIENRVGGQVSYDGEALLKAGEYALSAVGSYASLPDDGGTSLFIFAWLDAPLGGPPFFYVTGLAAGFGYNRSLKIPALDEVGSFPLVAGVTNATAVGGDPSAPGQPPDPAKALGALHELVPPQRGEMWLAVGVQFTSFEIVKSDALLVVEFGDELVVALLGIATLQQPIEGPTWVWAELDLEVVFRPREGSLTAAAVLAPGSYVLTGDAHLEGGFGFSTWFGGNPHAGDFVLSIGGYHPAFDAPAWYPQEPRVGIDWQVSTEIVVVGNAYFALTPAAMMAGAELQLTFEAGPLKAWLKADANAIVFWHPFYFDIEVSISIGISFHLHVLFVDVTISIEIGVDFRIYGPDIGFKAHVDWYIVSFTIGAGADPRGAGTLAWEDFKALAPAKRQDAPPSERAAFAMAVDDSTDAKPQYLTISARSGLRRMATVDGASHWLVRARDFVVAVEAWFPPREEHGRARHRRPEPDDGRPDRDDRGASRGRGVGRLRGTADAHRRRDVADRPGRRRLGPDGGHEGAAEGAVGHAGPRLLPAARRGRRDDRRHRRRDAHGQAGRPERLHARDEDRGRLRGPHARPRPARPAHRAGRQCGRYAPGPGFDLRRSQVDRQGPRPRRSQRALRRAPGARRDGLVRRAARGHGLVARAELRRRAAGRSARVSDDCAHVEPGGIRLYDSYKPEIETADYTLTVTQHVTRPDGTVEPYTASQDFSVAGPKWSMPAEDVFSVLPAPGAVGAFGQFLPHVVLTKPDLPWERHVFAGKEANGRLPWLAILVFGEKDPGLVAGPTTITAQELFANADTTVLWPDITPEWYEKAAVAEPSTVCTVIDVAPGAFVAQLPSADRLRWLTHARQVDATAKDSDTLHVAGDGWYSVVVGSRLPEVDPTLPRKNTAHLVSLDGFAGVVGTTPSKPVRMVSFYSWSFTCVPEAGETFEHLVDALTAESSTAFALTHDSTDNADEATQFAGRALDRGYVPLRYQTRPGEKTFGWYRGPFSPVRVPRFTDPSKPYGSASAAMIYDPGHGVFDLSYGVAWETGRMLGLTDTAFSQALLGWRRKGHRLVDLIAERKAQGMSTEDILKALQPYALTDDFMRQLVAELGGQLVAAGGASGPPVRGMPAVAAPPSSIADLLAEPAIQAQIRDTAGQELDAIADWLARRYLLMGVPFDALVANAGLLPPESVRFFHLDANWQDALLEGALSVATETSRDVDFQELMKDLVWDTTMRALNTIRTTLTGETPADSSADPPEMAGMLLRSALVPGWPGLEVRGYADKVDGTLIPLLRMERLSAGVLLCLWPDVPAAVAIEEPSEGIALGFEDPPDPKPDKATDDWLYLRHTDTALYGQPYAASDTAHQFDAGPYIGEDDRIVDVAGLVGKLEEKLGGTLAPRDVAVQLIKVPERGVFQA